MSTLQADEYVPFGQIKHFPEDGSEAWVIDMDPNLKAVQHDRIMNRHYIFGRRI